VFYINAYGQEIYPTPNLDFLSAIASRDIMVYSCGSLWTRFIISSIEVNYLADLRQYHALS